MASLGELVTGVAHEINTPIGICVTAASHLERKSKEITELLESGQMKKSDLTRFLESNAQSSEMLLSNLKRADELIQSFKQVAVDQSNEERRSFDVKKHFNEILVTLKPQFNETEHVLTLNCEDSVTIDSYPGAFVQVITNLAMNSLIHAYDEGVTGQIQIDVTASDDDLMIEFTDDGRGIAAENIDKVFDPFFTTRRELGKGLGLHIVYNLIVQKLGGTITCEREVSKGTKFRIRIQKSGT
jgi:signal transduction histidine kinase